MEVLGLSFIFIVISFFIVLAFAFKSRTLYFASGIMLIIFGYLLLSYGMTDSNAAGKNETQVMAYLYNSTSNTTKLANTTTTASYAYNTIKNDYTNAYGTMSLILGLAIAIVPILQEASGGRITLV
jgi:hypothetical protein